MSITKIPRFFFIKRQQEGITEDVSEEVSLDIQENGHKPSKLTAQEEVDKLPQCVSQNLAQEILSQVCNDYQRLYNNQEISKNPLYRLLFKEGINWERLITSESQMRMVEDSPMTEQITFVYFFQTLSPKRFLKSWNL